MTGTRSQPTPVAVDEIVATAPRGTVGGWVLDPRTAVVILLAASITIMAPGGLWFVPASLVAGVLLAITERAWRRVFGLPAAAAAAAGVGVLRALAGPWAGVGP
ncbi:hypothetical protein ABZ016_32385, partial [Streptomyces sp. NPDC006372]|uniref:hypothetical protein n=1 Tax=Streptomyces sp. NPDC006372 TaxID=3155599 RepID=UPI0033A9338A